MIKDIKDLFVYLIQNLHASEVQMLTALPAIIEKAGIIHSKMHSIIILT